MSKDKLNVKETEPIDPELRRLTPDEHYHLVEELRDLVLTRHKEIKGEYPHLAFGIVVDAIDEVMSKMLSS